MLIIVNPYSAGGTALKKWEKVVQKIPPFNEVFFLDSNLKLDEIIQNSLSAGEDEFVAAGGDGTVNLLLNKLISIAGSENIHKIKLGAIGLGSSNDFHKPLNGFNIPVKINFGNAEERDVGYINYCQNNTVIMKYFLINASLGITADANYFFNNPDNILEHLKELNTNLAIAYSALRTILKNKNKAIEINSKDTGYAKYNLTNLGVVKNPNFSGDLSYGGYAEYDNGKFDIHLCYDMKKIEIFNLLLKLTRHSFNLKNKAKSWSASEVEISSANPFSVEFDGEVVSTGRVKFGIIPKYLKVCHD